MNIHKRNKGAEIMQTTTHILQGSRHTKIRKRKRLDVKNTKNIKKMDYEERRR